MNAAIRDGYDLGWKLAWVLRGWAEDGLLDTYGTERRPAVEHNLARSSDSNGSQRDVADELHVGLRGRIAHLWLREGDERISTLDLIGGELTLLRVPAGSARSRWSILRTGRPPCPSASCRPSRRAGWGSPRAARCWSDPTGFPPRWAYRPLWASVARWG